MKCCICGEEIDDYGNNPWPISTHPHDVCCDECNREVVIPERIRLIQARAKANANKIKYSNREDSTI